VVEFGSKIVGTRRTSLVVDPPDGMIPALTPDGARRALDNAWLWVANGDYVGGAAGSGFDSYPIARCRSAVWRGRWRARR
jgi:hypothetical protein